MDPVLIDISNAFYTGNYQQCINLCEKVKVNLKNLFSLCFQVITVLISCFAILEATPGEGHFLLPIVLGHQPVPDRS